MIDKLTGQPRLSWWRRYLLRLVGPFWAVTLDTIPVGEPAYIRTGPKRSTAERNLNERD